MPGYAWSDEEVSELRAAVRVHGLRWARIVRSGRLPGRTALSMRKQWQHLAPLQAEPVLPAGVVLVWGSSEPRRGLLTFPVAVRGPRSRLWGRPWDYIMRVAEAEGGPAVRDQPRTARQRQLVANWRLAESQGGVPILCPMARGEAILVRRLRRAGVPAAQSNVRMLQWKLTVQERDELGLVFYPGSVCTSVTAGSAHLTYVGGPGGGGYVTPREVAGFMGIEVREGTPFAVARRMVEAHHYTNVLLCQCLGDSVPLSLASRCLSAVQAVTCQFRPETIGSLYSGGFDHLAEVLRKGLGGLEFRFVAETDPRRREMLVGAYAPLRVYATAEEAVRVEAHVDVLAVTAPCVDFSSLKRSRNRLGAKAVSLKQAAYQAVRRHVAVLSQALRRLSPCVVVLEQTDGLRTQHPACYGLYRQALRAAGYQTFHGVCSTQESGDSHFRTRLLSVMVQVHYCRVSCDS